MHAQENTTKMDIKFIFLAILTISRISNSEPIEDKQALVDFLLSTSISPSLPWNLDSSPCTNWTGVTCNQEKTRVISLRINGFRFHTQISQNTLGRLTALRIFNLGSNSISGAFPSDLSKLRNLTALYLQNNNFSGPLPKDYFSIWDNLYILNLSNNAFNGTIPSSISNLTRLTSLNLSNNSFSGHIQEINLPNLQVLDISNNNFSGNIPQSLEKFPTSAFLGNNFENISPNLSPPLPPTIQLSTRSKKFKKSEKLGIIIGGCSLISLAILALFILFYSKKHNKNGDSAYICSNKKEGFITKVGSSRVNENVKLVFFDGCNLAFDLEDLLRASAEVLGKGTFGTTYKAALEDANTIAVKRVREASIGKRDFEHIMGIVGSIRHENVVSLRAYYYSKDEKLMVYDYYSHGSVSAMLYAKRGENRTPLNWETRLSIAIGAARGIAHIHEQNTGKLVHGNIKASNIFLNLQGYGSISDLGLTTLISPTIPPSARNTGYRAPEITDTRRATQSSDVYSFGVFLLELLTGRSPGHVTGGETDVVHLVRWVNSVVREEWTAEVFDVELVRYPNIEEEMVEMLQIGLTCAALMPEERPRMTDVVRRLEDIRRVRADKSTSESGSECSTPGPTPKMANIGPSFVTH